MRNSIAWFVIPIIVLASAHAEAQEPFNGFWKNRQARQEEAQRLHDSFTELNAQIPTLSPAEQNWIKAEIDDELSKTGTYTKRALDAMKSKEYDLHMAKPHVEYIVTVLSQLSTMKFSDQRQEVILWGRLAQLLMDYSFWQSIDGLVQRGIVQKKINGYDAHYYSSHTELAKYILSEIVISHLHGNLGK